MFGVRECGKRWTLATFELITSQTQNRHSMYTWLSDMFVKEVQQSVLLIFISILTLADSWIRFQALMLYNKIVYRCCDSVVWLCEVVFEL